MALDETVLPVSVSRFDGRFEACRSARRLPPSQRNPSRRRAIPSILSPFQPAKGEASVRSLEHKFYIAVKLA